MNDTHDIKLRVETIVYRAIEATYFSTYRQAELQYLSYINCGKLTNIAEYLAAPLRVANDSGRNL